MILYLKGYGFKHTNNDVLSNREFREVSTEYVFDETLSTFSEVKFKEIKTYELFLDDKSLNIDKLKTIISDLRFDARIITGSFSIEKQERGHLVKMVFDVMVVLDDPVKEQYIQDDFIERI